MESIKTSVRQLVGAEHVFGSSGGDAQGVHLPGSARAWFGAQSAVSSSGTDGRLYWASDTSKLFHPGSGGTCLVGAGPLALSIGSMIGVTFPQRSYVVEEFGVGITGASGLTTITYPNSGFSGVPFVFFTAISDSASPYTGGRSDAIITVTSPTASSVGVIAVAAASAIGIPNVGFYWRSIGTRAL